MINRYTSLRPKTLADHFAGQAKAAERKRKRIQKRRELGLGPDRTTVRAQLDHLWSLIIRRRDAKVAAGYCLICVIKERMGIARYQKQPIQVAYHVEPRGNDLVRWRFDNGCGACKRCNDGEKWSRSGGRAIVRETYRRIHIELLGGGVSGRLKIEDLEALAKQHADFSTADLITKRDEMKMVLEGKS